MPHPVSGGPPVEPEAPIPGSSTLKDLLWAGLHLAVLWTLAMAQPLLEILADEPAFFVARDNTNGDIVAVALILTLGPPTVLAAVEALLVGARDIREAVHLIFVGGLAAVLVLQIIADAGGSGTLLIALAGVGGVLFAYRALRGVPLTLSVLAPAPVLLIAWFLLLSPVSDLLFPDEAKVVASTERPNGPTPPVIFIVFDEFFGGAISDSRGRVDSTRYPNFADLAAHSTWYRYATSVSGETQKAVPAILSARYPEGELLPTVSDYPGNVFTLVAGHYAMDVTEQVTALCSREICGDEPTEESTGERWSSLASDLTIVGLHTILPERLRAKLPAVNRTFGSFRGQGRDPSAGVTQKAAAGGRKGGWEQFVSELRPSAGRPAFHFYHSLLPHVPWQYLPSGKQYAVVGADVPGLGGDEMWTKDAGLVHSGEQRFLLQVGFVDRQLGQLMRQLRATRLFNRSLVVVTADHGVSFRPGGNRRGLDPEHPADIASVPLFVKFPNQREAHVDDQPVRTIDIVPTIAALLGVTPNWKVDGRSFLTGVRRPPSGPLRFVGAAAPFTFAQFVQSRAETIEDMIGLFGERDGGAGIFATGTPQLLGRSVVEADLPARPDAHIQLDQASLLTNVDLSSSVLPVFLSGSVAAGKPKETVAVVVNSRIRAITTTFSDAGAVRFAATVPSASLRQGANTVGLVALEGPVASPSLVKLGTAARGRYRLVERDGREFILPPGGKDIPVDDGFVQGYVDAVDLATSLVSGWAVDPEAKKPAKEVIVFDRDRFLSQAPVERPRPDLAGPVGSWATAAGFHVTIPAEGVDQDDVRVFAVVNGRADEL